MIDRRRGSWQEVQFEFDKIITLFPAKIKEVFLLYQCNEGGITQELICRPSPALVNKTYNIVLSNAWDSALLANTTNTLLLQCNASNILLLLVFGPKNETIKNLLENSYVKMHGEKLVCLLKRQAGG